MYRSTEIIQSFYRLNIPKEITKRILEMEREILFKNSLYEWLYLSKACRQAKFRRFFYEENHILFMQDIESINGDRMKLNEYRNTYSSILRANNVYANHLERIRY